MIDAQTRIRAILGSANLLSQDDAIEAAQAIEQLGTIIAGTNLLASHMMAALSATNGDALEQVEKAFKAAYLNLKSNLDSLTKNNDTAALKDAALKLLAFGDGKTSVFKTRQKELDADDYGQLILDETRKLNVGLGISVKQLVDGVQTETDASTWQARQEISFATVVMLALGASPSSDPCCSSGSMSAATSCGGSAICNARCSFCRAAILIRKFIAAASATRSRRWRIRWRSFAGA
jgi:hypothetical protein